MEPLNDYSLGLGSSQAFPDTLLLKSLRW